MIFAQQGPLWVPYPDPTECRDAGKGLEGEDGEWGLAARGDLSTELWGKPRLPWSPRLAPVYPTASGPQGSSSQSSKHLWAAGKEEGGKSQMEGKRRLKSAVVLGNGRKGGEKEHCISGTISAFQTDLGCPPWLPIPTGQGWIHTRQQWDYSGLQALNRETFKVQKQAAQNRAGI